MKKHTEDIHIRPATSPEEQEMRCIALANDLVEKRLREGTATSQETVHFLKLGSKKDRLEREKLEEELKLIKAKTEALQSGKSLEEKYDKAIAAMMLYRGISPEEDSNDQDI